LHGALAWARRALASPKNGNARRRGQEGGEGGTLAADGLGAGFAAGLGKLDDAATRRLCSEQFMLVQPGRRPVFCRFDAGAEAFGDGAPSAKACSDRYNTKARYPPPGVLQAGEAAASDNGFGAGPRGAPEDRDRRSVVLQLAYLSEAAAGGARRLGASVPGVEWQPGDTSGYAPTGGCYCLPSWSWRPKDNTNDDAVRYFDGGCYNPNPRSAANPDGDALPWCITATDETGCGLVRDGYSYQTCLDRCVRGEGCPVQVWCRDNATLPLPCVGRSRAASAVAEARVLTLTSSAPCRYIDRSTIYFEPESLESETYYYVLYISGLVPAGACPSPALPSNSLGMQR
jgi:hypothetical protein